LQPLVTGHPISCWSRDRWLAMAPVNPDQKALLLAPFREEAYQIWPQRRGDMKTAFDLAGKYPEKVSAARSKIVFDGGDFATDDKTVFITAEVVKRNPDWNKKELQQYFSSLFLKDIVILSDPPPHHTGMFMMPIGRGKILVGDPRLAIKLIKDKNFSPPLMNPDLSPEIQQKFDSVAKDCIAHGYQVTRIPILPDRDGRTYLTYLNVIIDEDPRGKKVFMPVYKNAEALNRQAASIWKDSGFQVARIDCSSSYKYFGSLRCLVNVMARGKGLD